MNIMLKKFLIIAGTFAKILITYQTILAISVNFATSIIKPIDNGVPLWSICDRLCYAPKGDPHCLESGSCNADSSPCKPIKLENMSRKIHGPLPQIPLVPTGGITAENAGEFIKAGAALVCVGSWLVDKKAVAEGRYEILTQRAHALMEAVKRAREKLREK